MPLRCANLPLSRTARHHQVAREHVDDLLFLVMKWLGIKLGGN